MQELKIDDWIYKKVIVYGVGNAGLLVIHKALKTGKSNILFAVDKSWEDIPSGRCQGVNVYSPGHILHCKDEYDYVVITMLNMDVRESVYANLVQNGVNQDKIVFTKIENEEVEILPYTLSDLNRKKL